MHSASALPSLAPELGPRKSYGLNTMQTSIFPIPGYE